MDNLQSTTEGHKNLLRALKVGDTVQLCTTNEEDEQRYPMTLIGWVPEKSIIVTPPENNNWPLIFQKNREYTVRLFSGTSAFAFMTYIINIHDNPYNHIHLSYPTEVHAAPVRNSIRASVDLAAEVESQKNDIPTQVEVIDASVSGVRIRTVTDLGNIGDRIKFSVHFKTGGKEWPVIITCIIRNKQSSKHTADGPAVTYYGLEFESIDENQSLIITSFLYEQLSVHQ